MRAAERIAVINIIDLRSVGAIAVWYTTAVSRARVATVRGIIDYREPCTVYSQSVSVCSRRPVLLLTENSHLHVNNTSGT